jgi:uncharacterized protein
MRRCVFVSLPLIVRRAGCHYRLSVSLGNGCWSTSTIGMRWQKYWAITVVGAGPDATMLIADVNLFVGAHRTVVNDHQKYRDWLETRLTGPETFGVSELVLSSFIRLVTNHRIFSVPTPVEAALEFCDVIRRSSSAVIVAPGGRHWEIFANLCAQTPARGNLVPDAYLAALAIENGATLATRDRGFARFRGVRLVDPMTQQS